jgi:hypothetical protein
VKWFRPASSAARRITAIVMTRMLR